MSLFRKSHPDHDLASGAPVHGPERASSKPPRHVPWGVRLTSLFGGLENWFGWVFFGGGLAFVWAFGASDLLHTAVYFHGELGTTEGRLSPDWERLYGVGDDDVVEYPFEYSVDRKTYRGRDRGFRLEFGDDPMVMVEYRIDDPARARVQGLDSVDFGLFFVWIFPAAGILFLCYVYRAGRLGRRLLQEGKLTIGRLVAIEHEGKKDEYGEVLRYVFVYDVAGEQVGTLASATSTADRFMPRDLRDRAIENLRQRNGHLKGGMAEGKMPEVVEPLLYDSAEPGSALLLRDFPGGTVQFNEQGELVTRPWALIVALAFPLMAVGLNIWWALRVLEVFG